MVPSNAPDVPCVVFVTTYPTRECGIATFTRDLITYTEELFAGQLTTKVVALKASGASYAYDKHVVAEIIDSDTETYINAAKKINSMPQVQVVSIQHEFGLFGENFGERIVTLLEHLKKPVAVTFHTVLPHPPDGMKRVVKTILSHSHRAIVMTDLSKKLLEDVYDADPNNISVIPHGIHPQLYRESDRAKAHYGMDGKDVLMTFGLLGRGKGIEYAISAMPSILQHHPNAVYSIVGATHPEVIKREGEAYRFELERLVRSQGVEKNVIFHNAYIKTKELLRFLEATDIYLSLSQNPDQAVSGTLSYALGTGRAVVSTAFMQAKELVTEEVGRLVGFGNAEEIAHAVNDLLSDPKRRSDMNKTAYFRTRNMTWSNVALLYVSTFFSLLPERTLRARSKKYMLPIKIAHLKRLTDTFGIFQFATLSVPNPDWGYTLDDNARALIAMCWLHAHNKTKQVERLAAIYLQFIARASRPNGGFINYFTKERTPHDELNENENLEDANARALWALAVAKTSEFSPEFTARATALFDVQISQHRAVVSPRAAAFYIKAFSLLASSRPELVEHIRRYANFLVTLFRESSDEQWKWFEETLTYSNAILPDALFCAYEVTTDQTYFDVGKQSLDFLLEQSFEGELCVPVGQAGWYKKGGLKERYDQQPEEVSALVLALQKLISIQSDPAYEKKIILAFDWFLGNNSLRQVVYTHSTGGCYDGIGERGINLNQGAESTVVYLLARLTLESAEQKS